MSDRAAKGGFGQIELRGITRQYGKLAAVNNLSLTVKAGEFVALLGPSGCGKSTALGCVAGLVPLTSGEIWIDDTRIDQLPTEQRDFGMVFQNYALFPHLSVRRNVAFGLEVRKEKKSVIDERVRWALSLVQLTGQEDKHPGQLSGGQQQRVAIARALAPHTRILLMDEPLSNLDAKLRLEMRSEIRRIHDELGLTTLYVTHDQEEALSVADRIVVLRAGQILQVGTPEEVYSQPADAYVADFMGYRNLLTMDPVSRLGDLLRVQGHGIALAGTPISSGESGPVLAAIRPDDVVLTEADGDNTFALRVDTAHYQGREMLVEGRLPGGQRIYVRTTVRVGPGDVVRAHVPADRVLLYAAGENPAASGPLAAPLETAAAL